MSANYNRLLDAMNEAEESSRRLDLLVSAMKSIYKGNVEPSNYYIRYLDSLLYRYAFKRKYPLTPRSIRLGAPC